MEIDATSDSASSPSLTELTVQQKSALAIPERTEEDEQRLFRLYQGWTFSERDGQVRQWVYQFLLCRPCQPSARGYSQLLVLWSQRAVID